MLNNAASKFKFKRPTFGVNNSANQSNLDGFITRKNDATRQNKETLPSTVIPDKREELRAAKIVDEITPR